MSYDNTHPSLFEHLPVEIVQEIFALLSLQELVKAFSGLNFHINSIIRSVRGISHTVRCNTTDEICFLHLFPAQINRLIISHVERIDFTSLINLRSLTLRYGTHAQFNSIRPHHFPMLEILHLYDKFDILLNNNKQAIHDLFQVILSNGFPRLRICTAAHIGILEFITAWTGSPALRSLQVDMNTMDDCEQLLSACPNLRRFSSFRLAWAGLVNGNTVFLLSDIIESSELNGLSLQNIEPTIPMEAFRRRRLFREFRKLEQLEFENKFILDSGSKEFFNIATSSPSLNNIPATQQWPPENGHTIQGRIFPMSKPYRRASFLIEIRLSRHYPFRQPEVIFLDPIYHPNVSLSRMHNYYFGTKNNAWKPMMLVADLILAVIYTIDNPDLDHRGNPKCSEEYRTNYPQFYANALKMTRMYGRPRR